MTEKSSANEKETFEEIIKSNRIYVDKTEYLARMIESGDSVFF
jgi:hypothetical protein